VRAWLAGGRLWRWSAIGVALVVVVAVKQFYRGASADELTWILGPTARAVSVVTGIRFEYEAGTGWVSRDSAFIIAPACAGLHFALAAFLAITIGSFRQMMDRSAVGKRLAIAAGLALAATVVVNTVRIAIALAIHRGAIDLDRFDPDDLHRIEGIVVYLAGLCAVCAIARAIERCRGGDALAS
jgi:exosortase K